MLHQTVMDSFFSIYFKSLSAESILNLNSSCTYLAGDIILTHKKKSRVTIDAALGARIDWQAPAPMALIIPVDPALYNMVWGRPNPKNG